jgi:hypothetical protein
MLGCPRTSTCTPQTHAYGCPQTSTCTPDANTIIGRTGTLHCTQMLGCPRTSTCTPQTHAYGCPQTSTCTPQGAVASEICATNIACNVTFLPPC